MGILPEQRLSYLLHTMGMSELLAALAREVEADSEKKPIQNATTEDYEATMLSNLTYCCLKQISESLINLAQSVSWIREYLERQVEEDEEAEDENGKEF